MRQKFIIPGRLMGMNEYVNACRSHWAHGAKAKREETGRVAYEAMRQELKPMEGPVEIAICWHEGKNKNGVMRDVDNIAAGAKFVLDGLVQANVIPDDSPKTVRNVYHAYRFNQADPHVEVMVSDYDPSGRTITYLPISGIGE